MVNNAMVVTLVVTIMVMTIISYLSDQQYLDKKGWRQLLPRPHDTIAPFSSFLSLTRLLLFLHIEAPVHEEMSLITDQIYIYLIPVVTATISAGDYSMLRQWSSSQVIYHPGKTLCDPFKACTMRLLLMQCIKMLTDEVMMDSFGQTFIQLINIRHCTM